MSIYVSIYLCEMSIYVSIYLCEMSIYVSIYLCEMSTGWCRTDPRLEVEVELLVVESFYRVFN